MSSTMFERAEHGARNGDWALVTVVDSHGKMIDWTLANSGHTDLARNELSTHHEEKYGKVSTHVIDIALSEGEK